MIGVIRQRKEEFYTPPNKKATLLKLYVEKVAINYVLLLKAA